MIGIKTEVTGVDVVTRRFRDFPPKLRDRLRVHIQRLTLKLQRKIVGEKLSGQVLRVRTGTGRRSIHQTVTVTDAAVVGQVDTNVRYMMAHERGFHGTVTVKQHMRLIKMAFGQSITPREVTVRSHPTTMNIRAKHYMALSLQELVDSGEVTLEIDAAVKEALE